MKILTIIKQAGVAPVAPAPAPAVPTAGASAAPTAGRPMFMGGRRVPAIAPSAPTGAGQAHAATPLQPTTPSVHGPRVAHNGMLVTPEEQAMQEEQAMLAQQEAEKNQPKAQTPEKPLPKDLRLDSTMVQNWDTRIANIGKLASDPGFIPERTLGDGSTTRFSPTPGLTNLPFAQFQTYNPFNPQKHPAASKIYGGLQQYFMRAIGANVPPAPGVLQKSLEGAQTPANSAYNAALAKSMADPVSTGPGVSPLVLLGSKLVGKFLSGGAPDPNVVQDELGRVEQYLRTPQ